MQQPEENGSNTNGRPLTYSVEEAARLLGIGRALAYQSVRDGTIPSVRFGRKIRVPSARLHALLEGDSE